MVRSPQQGFKLGPFRLTFSPKGLQCSLRMKGWRGKAQAAGYWISVTPLGPRYWRFAPQAQAAKRGSLSSPNEARAALEKGEPLNVLRELGVLEISESNAEALCEEWSRRQGKVLPWSTAFTASAALLFAGVFISPVLGFLLSVSVWFYWSWQNGRAYLPLWYDLDPTAEQAWQNLREAMLKMSQSRGCWLSSRAGADHPVRRESARLDAKVPSFLCTNQAPLALNAGPVTVYFLPDQVMLRQGNGGKAVSYHQLQAEVTRTQFIEHAAVPSDARVVGHTWRHANKNGSPDRRFKDNRQIPICEYEVLTFHSSSGLHQQYHFSRLGVGEAIVQALRALGPQQLAAPSQISRTTFRQVAPSQIPEPVVAMKSSQPPPLPVERRPAPRVDGARFASPLPEPLPPRKGEAARQTSLQWAGPGESLRIHDITVAQGMCYWWHGGRNEEEPSAVDLSKSIAAVAAPADMDLSYWPSYADLSPEKRRTYLEWLAQGRRDREPSRRALGYVFLFIYGLERRMLLDTDWNPALVEELFGLIEHYGAQRFSLRSYGLQLLHFVGWRMGNDAYRALWPRLVVLDPEGRSDGEAMPLIGAQLCQSGEPLHWSMAWRIARMDPISRNNTVVRRTRDKFWELFRQRYEELYPGGMILTAAKSKCVIDYRPASGALLRLKSQRGGQKPFQVEIPNVLGMRRQFRSLPEIWNACVDELSGYSRTLASRKPASVAALTSWQALPSSLRTLESHPLQRAFQSLLQEAPLENDLHMVAVAQVAQLLGISERAKLTPSQCQQVTSLVSDLGYYLAPHSQYTSLPLSWNQEVAVYPRAATGEPSAQFAGLVRFLYLAVTLAAADGDFAEEEMAVFYRLIRTEMSHESDLKHLQATEAALRRDATVALRSLNLMARQIQTGSRQAVLRILMHLVAADGVVTLDEIKTLRRITRAFGLEEEVLQGLLEEATALAEVIVSNEAPGKANGERISRKEATPSADAAIPSFQLDMSKVQALTAETHEVITLLSAVMAEDEEPEPAPSPGKNATSSPSWMEGLADRYHRPLLHLMEQDEVSLQRFDSIATEHHLLSDDLLTAINSWSDEYLGDFLLERGEDVRVFRELVITAQAA